MICAEARERIQPWADGQLVAQEMDAISDHVADCASCSTQAEALQRNLSFVRDRLGRLAGRLPSDLTFLDELETAAPPNHGVR